MSRPRPDGDGPPRWSRRRVLAGAGATAAVAATGAGATILAERTASAPAPVPSAIPLWGPHQPGIITPPPARLHFAAFDVITDKRSELVALLREWTTAADQLMAGQPIGTHGATGGHALAPPEDTGEALGLGPSQLTITVGFGPSLFADASGNDRFGLRDRKPAALADLPHFAGDVLDPARSGGDLCIQACAEDPLVVSHAVRNLARIGFGRVKLRWSQFGFGQPSSSSPSPSGLRQTGRNLLGFKDGTNNIKVADANLQRTFIWVGPGDDPRAGWMEGGSYLVARRIRMHIETWDRTSLGEQEAIIGRDKREGAPLSGGTEFTELDFASTGRNGPLVADTAHVRLAHPTNNGGARLLRRGYNFIDGNDDLGRLDAGLFFIAFVRDPITQFVPVQTALSRSDALNEYLQHTSSAVFAVPPGVEAAGSFFGEALFT